jgi:mercuric ion transport protein
MTETQFVADSPRQAEVATDRRQGWLAAGGLIGAFLASTCCIVPLALVLLGVSGAWIGTLTAFEPYKLLFSAITLVFVGLGFWHVYFRPRPACADGSYCARPRSTIITQFAFWFATVIVVLAMTIRWWAPLFY